MRNKINQHLNYGLLENLMTSPWQRLSCSTAPHPAVTHSGLVFQRPHDSGFLTAWWTPREAFIPRAFVSLVCLIGMSAESFGCIKPLKKLFLWTLLFFCAIEYELELLVYFSSIFNFCGCCKIIKNNEICMNKMQQ